MSKRSEPTLIVNVEEMADHSASLVGIAIQLGNSPFGVVHRRLAPSFTIVVLWVIGQHSTASRNISVMRQLLPFSTDLILYFRARHTRTEGEICATADHSVSLVEIADQLGDSPFGVVHRRLAPSFSIVVLWVIG
uniref:Uncharacterized protein n=1 Tax=Solanum tuberosum TaxID=4113 RepID=M1DCE5_SOLTU